MTEERSRDTRSPEEKDALFALYERQACTCGHLESVHSVFSDFDCAVHGFSATTPFDALSWLRLLRRIDYCVGVVR